MDLENTQGIYKRRKRIKQIEKFQGPTYVDITPTKKPSKNPSPRQDRIGNFFRSRIELDMISKIGFHSGPVSRRKGYVLAAWSWLAASIDALILVSLSCVFLLIFAQIAKQLQLSGSTIKSFSLIYVLCLWVYMVSLRVFAGHTIGEWACDLRLGQPQQRMRSSYFFHVFLRIFLISATGIVTFPLLSMIFKTDVVGKLSGVKLFSLK